MQKLFKGLQLLLLALVTFNIVMFARHIQQQEALKENAQAAGELAKAKSAIFEDKLKRSALHVITNIGTGSAIYLDNGIAVSAAHVCDMFEKAHKVYVKDAENNKMRIHAYERPRKAKDKKPALDLCIIKFQPKMKYMPITRLASGELLNIGTKLLNPNYGGGEFYSLRAGEVIADETLKLFTDNCVDMDPFGRMGCEHFVLYNVKRTTVPGVPGASGSGIINTDGELVGILVLGAGDFSRSAVVPLKEIKQFLRKSALYVASFN